MLVTLTGSAAASDKDRSWAEPWEREYLTTFDRAHEAGLDTGRNLVDCHWLEVPCVARPRVEESTARMERWLSPAPEPVAAAEPVVATSAPAPSSGGVGNATVQCESGGDYSINTGNGYYGGYQFDSQTWDAYGDSSYEEAHLAPPSVQDQAAASVPYDAWPNC